MQYTLSNCFISAFCTCSDKGGNPVDHVTINYGKIGWCHTRQSRAAGAAAGHCATGWDLQKNTKM